MKPDITEKFREATIQHGKYNNRVYLLHAPEIPDKDLPQQLIQLAREKGYSKIFGKIPDSQKSVFTNAGFCEEAIIPNFFINNENCYLLSYFLSTDRKNISNKNEINEIIHKAKTYSKTKNTQKIIPKDYQIKLCTKDDIKEMSKIYKHVFTSYPFPIHDPVYLLETMNSHIDYFAMKFNSKIIALASSEKDLSNNNAEMTDFATLPEHRGKGIAQALLGEMEKKLMTQKINKFYTICRAISPGMNITFAKQNYNYMGTLINNTNISGQIESMNIWSKKVNV